MSCFGGGRFIANRGGRLSDATVRGKSLPRDLSRMLHRRTGGHPLFMVSLVDDLVQQGVLREGFEGCELLVLQW
jgi:hypothetical protein